MPAAVPRVRKTRSFACARPRRSLLSLRAYSLAISATLVCCSVDSPGSLSLSLSLSLSHHKHLGLICDIFIFGLRVCIMRTSLKVRELMQKVFAFLRIYVQCLCGGIIIDLLDEQSRVYGGGLNFNKP